MERPIESANQKISLEEAAEFLECTVVQVMEELRAGTLPGVKIGKPWVIPRPAFFTAVNEMAVTAAAVLRDEAGKAAPPSTDPLLPKRRGRPRRPRSP